MAANIRRDRIRPVAPKLVMGYCCYVLESCSKHMLVSSSVIIQLAHRC